jgi:hypothetical protein
MNRYYTFDRINNDRILSFYSQKPMDFGGPALEGEGRAKLIRQIEDFTAKAEGQITTKSDRAEGLTVSFWFYDLEDEKIPEFAADFAADLCELIKEPMQQGEIAHLYFYFDVNEEGNEDRERLYFSINKYYSERHMQMYEVVSNNTKADDDEVLEMLVSRLGKIEGLENLVALVAGVRSRVQPGGDPVPGVPHEGDIHQHKGRCQGCPHKQKFHSRS